MFGWLKRAFRNAPTIFPLKPDGPVPTPWVREFADKELEDRRYTPDLPQLERQEWWWLFVCNEMQRGHHAHELVQNCHRYELDVFTQPKYLMLQNMLGIFTHPLVFQTDLQYKNVDLLPIKGELYRVSAVQFCTIDKYMLNGVSSLRRQIPVVVPFEKLWVKDRAVLEKALGKETKPNKITGKSTSTITSNILNRFGVIRAEAWIYFADEYHWVDELNLNDKNPPVQSFKTEAGLIKEYYRFTPPPDDKPPWE